MHFFLDANLPVSTKEIFARYGEVWHAADVGLAKASDEKIARWSRERDAVLVTKDLGFSNPHLFPAGAHHGLVILRVPSRYTAKQIKGVLRHFLTEATVDDLPGTITLVEPRRVRRRTL